MPVFTWKEKTLSDVCNDGVNYMYSLLCDYEKYISNFGYIPINIFLQNWTCISYKSFESLCQGDIVYGTTGLQYIIMDDPFESDDEALHVEVAKVNKDGSYDRTGSSNFILNSGDIYYHNVTHKDYNRKKIKTKESEEPLCPILITKTNQHQN